MLPCDQFQVACTARRCLIHTAKVYGLSAADSKGDLWGAVDGSRTVRAACSIDGNRHRRRRVRRPAECDIHGRIHPRGNPVLSHGRRRGSSTNVRGEVDGLQRCWSRWVGRNRSRWRPSCTNDNAAEICRRVPAGPDGPVIDDGSYSRRRDSSEAWRRSGE